MRLLDIFVPVSPPLRDNYLYNHLAVIASLSIVFAIAYKTKLHFSIFPLLAVVNAAYCEWCFGPLSCLMGHASKLVRSLLATIVPQLFDIQFSCTQIVRSSLFNRVHYRLSSWWYDAMSSRDRFSEQLFGVPVFNPTDEPYCYHLPSNVYDYHFNPNIYGWLLLFLTLLLLSSLIYCFLKFVVFHPTIVTASGKYRSFWLFRLTRDQCEFATISPILPFLTYNVSPFDLELYRQPLIVERVLGFSVIRNYQGIAIGPHCEIRPSTYGLPVKMVARGNSRYAAPQVGGSPHRIYPVVTILDTEYEHTHLLKWRIDDVVYLKLSSSHGWLSMPNSWYQSLAIRYGKSDRVQLQDVSSYMKTLGMDSKDPDYHLNNSIILAWLGGEVRSRKTTYFTQPIRLGGELLDSNHHKDYHTDILPPATGTPAVLPSINDSNDVAAIVTRIIDVNPGTVKMAFESFLDEFIQLMQNNTNVTFSPITTEEVVDSQKTCSTRTRMERAAIAILTDSNPKIDAFIKKEAYPDFKDPRNISNIAPEHNMVGFRFLLPFKQHVLKHLPWYMPCRTPRETGMLVHSFVASNTTYPIVEGDYSRFDGTQCETTRRIAFRIMRHFVDANSRKEFDLMIDQQFKSIPTTCVEHRPYSLLGSMVSGSWSTTDGNTLLNAFVCYVARRRSGIDQTAAFNVGVVFGDDSITSCDPSILQDTAKTLGLSLKSDVRPDHVTFLSRIYPFPKDSGRSYPDVRRVMDKIHIVPRVVKPEERPVMIQQKLSSILLLSAGCPLVADYCRKTLHLFRLQPLTFQHIGVEYLNYWISLSDEDPEFEALTDADYNHCIAHTALSYKLDETTIHACINSIKNSTNINDLYNVLPSSRESSDAKMVTNDSNINEVKVREIDSIKTKVPSTKKISSLKKTGKRQSQTKTGQTGQKRTPKKKATSATTYTAPPATTVAVTPKA